MNGYHRLPSKNTNASEELSTISSSMTNTYISILIGATPWNEILEFNAY